MIHFQVTANIKF